MIRETKVIYEPHPVSEKRKAKLQAEGYRIIDARFAPPGTPLHERMEIAEDQEIVVEEAPEIEPEVPADIQPVEDHAFNESDGAKVAKAPAPKRGRRPKVI